jgi:hypothetical protein
VIQGTTIGGFFFLWPDHDNIVTPGFQHFVKIEPVSGIGLRDGITKAQDPGASTMCQCGKQHRGETNTKVAKAGLREHISFWAHQAFFQFSKIANGCT